MATKARGKLEATWRDADDVLVYLLSSLVSECYPILSYLLTIFFLLNQRLNDRSLNPSSRGQSAAALAARKEGRSKYQFEATASDDELEDELDDDLNETLDVTKRLKALAVASG